MRSPSSAPLRTLWAVLVATQAIVMPLSSAQASLPEIPTETVSASKSHVEADRVCTSADGVSTATIVVSLRDAQLAPVGNTAVSLTQTGSAVITPPALAETDVHGQITFLVTNTTAEDVTFTAIADGGTTLEETVTIRFGEMCGPAFSLATSSARFDRRCLPSDGTTAATFTITARTIDGLPVAGVLVDVIVTGDATLTPASGLTGEDGKLVISVTSNTEESLVLLPVLAGNILPPLQHVQEHTITVQAACWLEMQIEPTCIEADNQQHHVILHLTGADAPNAVMSSIGSFGLDVQPAFGTADANGFFSTYVRVPAGVSTGLRYLGINVGATGTLDTLGIVSDGAACDAGPLRSSWKATTTQLASPGETVPFTVTVPNDLESDMRLMDVTVSDVVEPGWERFTGTPSVVSGRVTNTDASLTAQDMLVSPNSVVDTRVSFEEVLKSTPDLASDLGIAASTNPELDGPWWVSWISDLHAQSSAHANVLDILGAPDNRWLSIGGGWGSVKDVLTSDDIQELGGYVAARFTQSIVVDGDGDDVLVLIHADGTEGDGATETYSVYASQDGWTYRLLERDAHGAMTFDLATSGLVWASSILILDTSVSPWGESPGVSVESIGALHVGAMATNTATISSARGHSSVTVGASVPVDLTSVMDTPLDACAFGVGDGCIGPVSGPNSSVTILRWDPVCEIDGGYATAHVEVTVRDDLQHPIPGADVQLVQTPGGALSTITPPGGIVGIGLTNGDGVVTFTVTWEATGSPPALYEARSGGYSLGTPVAGPIEGSCTVNSLACTDFTYSAWGTCTNGLQGRSVVSALPANCTGGTPILTQSCSPPPPPICTSYTYSEWGTCTNGTQTRGVMSSAPSNCIGGTPVLTQSCTVAPGACTSFTYSDWGSCTNGTQMRTVASATPPSCTGGTPETQRACSLPPPTCSAFTYSEWGTCTNGMQQRGVITSTPVNCVGGSPQLTQSCTNAPPTCSAFTYSEWTTCVNSVQTRSILGASPTACVGGTPDVTTRACTMPVPTLDVSIAITSPKGGEDFTTKAASVNLGGRIGADVATVEVNGKVATIDGASREWHIRVSLSDDDNTLVARAYNTDRSASGSASITITRDDTAPDAVRDLRGEARGNSSILSWKSPSDDDVKTYHVYRVSGSSGTMLLSTRSTTATVVGFGPFAVTSEDKNGNESDLSDAPRVTVGRDTGFEDVPREHGASASIASLHDRGIVNGRSAGRFDPDGLVTRAEFAKMLAGARGISPEDGRTGFRDVPSRSSLAGYIAAIVSRGWASGQDSFFGPWRPVTRLEAARMIVRAAGLAPVDDVTFSDVTDGDARGIVGALVRAGIAAGHDGLFDPDRPLTRAEAAIMLAALPAV